MNVHNIHILLYTKLNHSSSLYLYRYKHNLEMSNAIKYFANEYQIKSQVSMGNHEESKSYECIFDELNEI